MTSLAAQTAREIELKLDIDAAALARLRRHPLVKQGRTGRTTTQLLHTVYFDTLDHALWRSGITVRVRHQGRQRILTVKSAVTSYSSTGGPFDRHEWETTLLSDTPSALTLGVLPLAGTSVEAKLIKALNAGLVPVFTTSYRRTTYHLQDTAADPAWEILLCLDHGTVETTTKSTALSEAELELLRGEPSDLFRLALALTADQSALVGIKAKAERGFDLLSGHTLKPAKAVEPKLNSEQSTESAFRAIAGSCLSQALHNAHVLREARVPEAIHQMRVGLRRLRSALALFAPLVGEAGGAAFRQELQWAASELGDARDAHVFLTEVVDPVARAFADDRGLQALVSDFEDRRTRGYERALAAVQSPRLSRLLLELGGWIADGPWCHPTDIALQENLAKPILPFAAGVLSKQHSKVLKQGRNFSELPAVTRHELRISLKRLRYACDFFHSLWESKTARTALSALSALQDDLGTLNDIAVAHDSLQAMMKEQGVSLERAFAAGLVAGWHGQAGRDQLGITAKAWKAFTKTPPFWV